MKQAFLFYITCIVLFQCGPPHPKADMVIFNAQIYTNKKEEPKAEAIAIKDGIITYLGNNVNANNWVDDSTTVLDINGKTLIPGFIEGHGHLMELGYMLQNIDLSGTQNYSEVIDLVKAKAKTKKTGDWIIGKGWHQDKWDSSYYTRVSDFPIHDSLSFYTPDNPVILYHSSNHLILVNQRAMDLAGISSNSYPEVKGGEVIMDIENKLTGVFNENAIKLITQHIPEPDDKIKIEALNLAIEECLKNGITSFHDGGVNHQTINLYESFLKNDMLSIRLYVMLNGQDQQLLDYWFEKGPSIGLGNGYLTVRSVKLYADGALDSRGALLHEAYSDADSLYGYRVQTLEDILKTSTESYNAGFQVATHCIGDRANNEVLDLYEIILKSDTTKENPRFRIEHAQHVSKEDIARFGKLGIIPSMRAIHMSSDRPWAIDRLGKHRIEEGAYAWRDLIDSDAVVMNGTDVPVEPINPIANFYASITRKTLKGTPKDGYEPRQKMTREEALIAYTKNNAFGAFEEDVKGSIEKGKYADFTVLSQDIMKVSEDKILNTEIEYTIINGKIEYMK